MLLERVGAPLGAPEKTRIVVTEGYLQLKDHLLWRFQWIRMQGIAVTLKVIISATVTPWRRSSHVLSSNLKTWEGFKLVSGRSLQLISRTFSGASWVSASGASLPSPLAAAAALCCRLPQSKLAAHQTVDGLRCPFAAYSAHPCWKLGPRKGRR